MNESDKSDWKRAVLECGCIVYNDGSRVWCQACGADWKKLVDAAPELVDPRCDLESESESGDPDPEPSYLERAKGNEYGITWDARQTNALISIAESLERIADTLSKRLR